MVESTQDNPISKEVEEEMTNTKRSRPRDFTPDFRGNDQVPKGEEVQETNLELITKLGTKKIGKSSLVLFRRPGKKTMPLLKSVKGVTLVVTVQSSKSEKPEEVKKLCDNNGIKHFFIELEGANEALLA